MMFALVSLVSCGKNGSNVVTNVKVQTATINDHLNLQVSADFDFGNIFFPSLQIPVTHQGQTVGSVSMIPVLGSKTQLVVDIDASILGTISPAGVTLPNGTLAPLIATNPAISVNLGGGAQLYIAAGSSAYALGVAIPISGLDSIGQSLGGINFFPMFTIDKAVGAAGIFASKTPGKSGFGFFVDLTQYLKGLNWGLDVASKSDAVAMSSAMMQQEVADIALDYTEIRPSASKESKLKAMLYDMNQRKVRLKR